MSVRCVYVLFPDCGRASRAAEAVIIIIRRKQQIIIIIVIIVYTLHYTTDISAGARLAARPRRFANLTMILMMIIIIIILMINSNDSNSNALGLAGRNTAFDTSAIVYPYPLKFPRRFG